MARQQTAIFKKQNVIDPNQLYSAADRRFRDAEALCRAGDNDRSTGAHYLAGFAIEILLKGQLTGRYPFNRYAKLTGVHSKRDQQRWALVWRYHNLEGMLNLMPDLQASLSARGLQYGRQYLDDLRAICSTWKPYTQDILHTVRRLPKHCSFWIA